MSIDPRDLIKQLQGMLEQDDDDDNDDRMLDRMNAVERIELLTTALAAYRHGHDFQVGDAIVWKPHMRNLAKPADDQPTVVIGLHPGEIDQDRDNTGSPYYRQPIDLAFAELDDDGDLVVYRGDSHRFMPWQRPPASLLEGSDDASLAAIRATDRVERLSQLVAAYHRRHDFRPGEIVRWKAGMRDRKSPRYGEPAIVAAVYPGEIESHETNSCSAYFRRPIDCSVFAFSREAKLLFIRQDANRFEPWKVN